MYSHHSPVAGLTASMSMRLDSVFDAAEENFWDDEDAMAQRPVVPQPDEQVLDTDYDPDPAAGATPRKNAPREKAGSKKSAKKG